MKTKTQKTKTYFDYTDEEKKALHKKVAREANEAQRKIMKTKTQKVKGVK